MLAMRRFVIGVGAVILLGLWSMPVRAADEAKKADAVPPAKSAQAAGDHKSDTKDQKDANKEKAAGKTTPAKPAQQDSKTAKPADKNAKPAEKDNKAAKPAEQNAKPDKAAESKPKRTSDLATVAKRLAGMKLADKKQPAKGKEKKTATVVQFTLHGEYPEGPSAPGMFGEMQPSLATLVERITATADDKDVAAVVLRIEDLALGRGKINELRGAIAAVRKAKKPVYAELASADTAEYLLAAACDEVIMPPSGMLMLPGVRAEMTFYKGLFDKVGLQFDVLQQGKYKGAGEPYSRTNMSPPLRESITAIVDDAYDAVANTVAQDRKLADYRVKSLMDEGLFTAPAAKTAGLVDRLLYGDELEADLRTRLKVDSVKMVTNYKKKKVDTDFSGIGGMMKLMELMFGGGKSTETSNDEPKIAVVYAVGPITEGKSVSDMWGSKSVGSTTLNAALRSAAEDATVKAVVLRIDSPGGSAVASDLIWREIVRMKKPVVASMSDVAGSGGYYIAMGANKIIAEPGTITGSIGVIGGKMVLGKLMDKIGISTEVIARGKVSGAMSSLKPFTPEERAAWTKLLEDTYAQFVSKAAQGRKMPVKKLGELAQGRIYSGRMAVANGLIDELGTLADAIAAAKTAAHLKPGQKVEIEVLPAAKTFFEQLFGDQAVADELDGMVPGIGKVLAQVRLMQRLFTEPSLMLMPCQIELK
jgi:protease-4